MKRNKDGYTYEISAVEDGFSVVITKPNRDMYITHCYIRSMAIKNAERLIEDFRHNRR